jgi:N-acetylglucosamine-6-phosphate deacetylase
MATMYPAKVAKVDDVLGTIAVGKRACFVELSSASLQVLKVWYDGKPLM